MCTRDSVFDVLSACLVSFHHLVATNLYPTNHERERERERVVGGGMLVL